MSILERITNLPGFQDLPSLGMLLGQINADMGNNNIWFVIVFACLMLTFHGIAVLMIAGTFHWVDRKLEYKRVYGANFLSYFIAILLILLPATYLKSLLGPISALPSRCFQLTLKPSISLGKCTQRSVMATTPCLSAGEFCPLSSLFQGFLPFQCLGQPCIPWWGLYWEDPTKTPDPKRSLDLIN